MVSDGVSSQCQVYETPTLDINALHETIRKVQAYCYEYKYMLKTYINMYRSTQQVYTISGT